MRKAEITQHRLTVIAAKGPKQFSCHNQIEDYFGCVDTTALLHITLPIIAQRKTLTDFKLVASSVKAELINITNRWHGLSEGSLIMMKP